MDHTALMTDIDHALGALLRIAEAEVSSDEDRERAAGHRRELDGLRERIESRERRVTFIGPVGVGKSSVLAALAGLHVGERPSTPSEQRAGSVLTLGSGKTTAFPVMVRAPGAGEPQDQIGLRLKPQTEKERRWIVESVAEAEIFARAPEEARGEDARPDPTGEELRRVVLNMCGYGERTEIHFEGGLKRTRKIRPLDAALPHFRGLSALTEHLLQRMGPDDRRQECWIFADNVDGLRELKQVFEGINIGTEPRAPLPAQVELILPSLACVAGIDGRLVMLDTRGLDGAVGGRADLFQALREPDALLLLCSSFTNAPSPEVRDVLRALERDRTLWEARERLALLIVDKGEGEGVVSAEGKREVGQVLRAEDCWRALEREGLSGGLERGRILVFDPLLDEASGLLQQFGTLHEALRSRLEVAALWALSDSLPLRNGEAGDKALSESIDEQLKIVLRKHRLEGEPMQDPLLGLKAALNGCSFAYRLRATLRREGTFQNLHLFSAVESDARAAITRWLSPLAGDLLSRLTELEQDESLPGGAAQLQARRRALHQAIDQTILDYGFAVRQDVERLAKGANVWQDGLNEWGKGPGFRKRVVEHFDRWGQLQPFTAHRATTLAKHIPLLAQVQQPEEPPGFTVTAERLRKLKRMSWHLQGVNLLIGANGAGKTTTLSVLRFLASAWSTGTDSAASQTLAAQSNLRTWGEDESEPVRITLEKGETRWEFELRPLVDQKGVDIRERLTHRGEEVFSVSELRRITYRGIDLGHVGRDCGLGHLMRLNKVDLPVNRMAALAGSLHSYRIPNLHLLKDGGTRPLPERPLEPLGGNAFSVLHRLKDAPGEAHKYDFVLEGLKLAFPGLVESLGFNLTETTVELYVIPPGGRRPNYIGQEADGVLQLLVNLVAVASANPGEVVALDQPDDHLHPYAARVLLRRVESWAHAHKLTVILATHSVVLLDAMKGSPERVFVMTPNDSDSVPNALTDLYNRDWLQSFELGELYKNDELGSNVDDA